MDPAVSRPSSGNHSMIHNRIHSFSWSFWHSVSQGEGETSFAILHPVQGWLAVSGDIFSGCHWDRGASDNLWVGQKCF